MINVVIDSVRKTEDEDILIVVLKETGRERYLVVGVPKNYGEFLVACLEQTAQIKDKDAPLNLYEIGKELLNFGRLKMDRVIISDIKDSFYRAQIVVDVPSGFSNKQKVMECHPSDALIIAVQTNAPIFVTEAIMKEKGILSRGDSNNTISNDSNAFS